MTDMPQDWLEIGRIVAPQGLDGSVRVYPDSDFPERFLEPGDRWLQHPRQPEPTQVRLLAGRYLSGKGLYVLKFADCTTRAQAEALRDARLLVPVGDRLPLEPEEFHVADLIGLEVRLKETGAAIGTVVDIYAAGNDLLAVQLATSATAIDPQAAAKESTSRRKALPKDMFLVPFVYAIVPVVNLREGYVEITPPAGLLPLA